MKFLAVTLFAGFFSAEAGAENLSSFTSCLKDNQILDNALCQDKLESCGQWSVWSPDTETTVLNGCILTNYCDRNAYLEGVDTIFKCPQGKKGSETKSALPAASPWSFADLFPKAWNIFDMDMNQVQGLIPDRWQADMMAVSQAFSNDDVPNMIEAASQFTQDVYRDLQDPMTSQELEQEFDAKIKEAAPLPFQKKTGEPIYWEAPSSDTVDLQPSTGPDAPTDVNADMFADSSMELTADESNDVNDKVNTSATGVNGGNGNRGGNTNGNRNGGRRTTL